MIALVFREWSSPDCPGCTAGESGPLCPPGRYPCTPACLDRPCVVDRRHWCSAHRVGVRTIHVDYS